MLHFVNQTEKAFVLRKTDDGILCLFEKDAQSGKHIKLVQLKESNGETDLYEAIVHKLGGDDGEFEITPRRTSKFHVAIPDKTVLYKVDGRESEDPDDDTLIMAHMFTRENGLSAKEYYFPKSIIFTIVDGEEEPISLEFKDETLNDLVKGDNFQEAPAYIGAVRATMGIRISAIFISPSKWNNMPEDTFIRVSSDRKLRFAVINKSNEGRDYTINALIRCDGEGNSVETKRSDKNNRNNNGRGHNGGGHNNGGKGGNKNKKKRGRGKLSDITSKIPTIQNG